MTTLDAVNPMQTLHIQKQTQIAAPLDIVFATVLEPQGRLAEMSLKIEPWPGGRWYRDLGNNAGHLWGHVQVIKPPTLLELVGPMFMSYPALSHVQYRLAAEGRGTLLTITHQAIGLIAREHAEGVTKGWEEILGSIRTAAEKKSR